MKRILLTLLTIFMANQTLASETGNYFRVWRGFKKAELNWTQFLNELPQFMTDTVDLYEPVGALNNYLVAIPPENKPDFIPDEFALVALSSEEHYREIRQTPEGRNYSARHWDVFDREGSRSAREFVNFFEESPEHLNPGTAYDMIGEAIDWRTGQNYFYIGLRKNSVGKETFLAKLHEHIEEYASRYRTKGLRGYIVIADENYEMAFVNWESEEHFEQAFTGPSVEDFMETLMWEKAQWFRGGPVEESCFYTAKEWQ